MQPPATKQASSGSPLVGLIVLIVVGVLIWYFFFNNSSSPPATSDTSGHSPAPATATLAPAFADIHLSGQGDSVPQFSIPADNAAIVHFTYHGSGNFAVFSLDSSGGQNDLLVNTIGNYDGVVLMDVSTGEHSVALDVTADGPWTATIQHPSKAPAWNGQGRLAGTSDSIYRVTPATSGLTVVSVTYSGEDNFAIWTYSSESGRDLAVNEIGSYSGQITLPSATSLLEITASGAWSITPG